MAAHTLHLHGGIDESKAGRESTFGKTAAKFYTEGSALSGTLHAQKRAAADFKFAGFWHFRHFFYAINGCIR